MSAKKRMKAAKRSFQKIAIKAHLIQQRKIKKQKEKKKRKNFS